MYMHTSVCLTTFRQSMKILCLMVCSCNKPFEQSFNIHLSHPSQHFCPHFNADATAQVQHRTHAQVSICLCSSNHQSKGRGTQFAHEYPPRVNTCKRIGCHILARANTYLCTSAMLRLGGTVHKCTYCC